MELKTVYKYPDYQKNYREKNRIKRRNSSKEYYRKNKLKAKNLHKKYHLKNKDVFRRSWLKCRHNLSEFEYNEMFNEQNGCCAICGKHQSSFNKCLSIDHDHKTGIIRGLLCFSCNVGLGNFKENKQYLIMALEYLGRFNDD